MHNRHHHTFLLSGMILLVSGCTQVIEAPYAPLATPLGAGQVAVGQFRYAPPATIAENQISFGVTRTRLLLDRPVADYLKDAAQAELQQSGLFTEGAACRLNGEAHRFHLDNAGFTADYSLDVTYSLSTGKDAQAYRKTITTTYGRANPFPGYGSNVAAAVGKNFSALFADPEFAQAIASHCTAKPQPAAEPKQESK